MSYLPLLSRTRNCEIRTPIIDTLSVKAETGYFLVGNSSSPACKASRESRTLHSNSKVCTLDMAFHGSVNNLLEATINDANRPLLVRSQTRLHLEISREPRYIANKNATEASGNKQILGTHSVRFAIPQHTATYRIGTVRISSPVTQSMNCPSTSRDQPRPELDAAKHLKYVRTMSQDKINLNASGKVMTGNSTPPKPVVLKKPAMPSRPAKPPGPQPNSENKDLVKQLEFQVQTMQRIINDMSQQVSRLNVERYSLLLEQEERKAEYIRKVEMLEGQILSLQMIVSESEQHQDSQTAERLQEQIRSLEAIINETEAQMSERESHVSERERVHLKEVEKLQQRKARNQESIACSICLSSWEESGEHRVVCLACGHLFGESCIRESLQRSSACPICRQAASDTEIRYIFCGNILAIET